MFNSPQTAIIDNANQEILKLNPIAKTITHKIVDPTLAQIIAPIAFGKDNNQAHTKAKIISETTLLDCKIAVIPNPLKIAFNGVLANLLSHFFKDSADALLIVSSKTSIPKSTIANPARKFHIEKSISSL